MANNTLTLDPVVLTGKVHKGKDPDSLQQTYYPSCIVDLRIRFDENMSLSKDTFPKLNKDALVGQPVVPAPYGGAPHLVEYASKTDASRLAARIPKKCSVELPAYRSAGKWSLTFNYNDLPIDPRTVRSLGVTIYMDTVTDFHFADNIAGTRDMSTGHPGEAAQMQRNSRLSMLEPKFENCVMQGVADSWQVSHSSSGSEVTIEGRDLRGVLIDSPIAVPMLEKLPIDKNIVEVVTWILSKHEYGKQMVIDPAPEEEWPDGKIPSPFTADGITLAVPRVLKGANGKSKTGATMNAEPETLNYWDIICKYCSLVGAVPYFQAEKLRIKPARNLYDQQSAGSYGPDGPQSPFAGGKPRYLKMNGQTEEVNYRRLMFGRSIEELNIERKLAGRTPQQIEVVSLDTSSRQRGKQKLLVARWPADKVDPNMDVGKKKAIARDLPSALVSGISPTDSAGKQDVLTIPYPGINDIKKLQQIAQDLYEEIGRGELGGSVKTKALASFGGDNEDPDLIRLRPGDAIALLVDARNLRTSAYAGAPLGVIEGYSDSALVQLLAKQLGDDNLARVIVATSRGAIAGLQSTFRVSNVNFDWDASSGLSIGFDFHNYVVARNAVLATPTQQSAAGGKKATAS